MKYQVEVEVDVTEALESLELEDLMSCLSDDTLDELAAWRMGEKWKKELTDGISFEFILMFLRRFDEIVNCSDKHDIECIADKFMEWKNENRD